MPRSCCVKPIAKIIKVGDFEAGIIGLETAMQSVYRSGVEDEEQIKTDLLQRVKEFGNYITRETESEYKVALWREYQKYVARTRQGELRESSPDR